MSSGGGTPHSVAVPREARTRTPSLLDIDIEPSDPLAALRRSLVLYQYITVDQNSKEFRVMELLPGRGEDMISCKLHVTNWTDLLPYEAVSYAWGDVTKRRDIEVEGKILSVTLNIYEGLSHLRNVDKSRFLWVDAIW